MPGVILADLCDEALTFHHDGPLLGFCLDDPDEPFGDDYHTRLLEANGDKYWIEVQDLSNDGDDDEGATELHEACFGDEDDDDAHESDIVAVTKDLYGDYCRMAPSQRAEAIVNLRSVIWLALDIDKADWNPGDDIVIECMKQSERLSPHDLRSWIKAQYHAATREYDDHIHAAFMREQDANVDDECWMPAHAGGHVKRKQAVREEENNYESSLWEVAHIGNFRDSANESNCRRKKCARTNIVCGRRETIRTDAERYFGFAGKGDGFEEYVERLLGIVFEEAERARVAEAERQEFLYYEGRMRAYDLDRYHEMLDEHLDGTFQIYNFAKWLEQLEERGDARGWPTSIVPQGKVVVEIDRGMLEHDLVVIQVFELRRVRRISLDLHDQLAETLHHDLTFDVDWDDTFFDYSGPDNPHSPSDDDETIPFSYADFLDLIGVNSMGDEDRHIGHSSRALIRRGTPRQVLRHMQ